MRQRAEREFGRRTRDASRMERARERDGGRVAARGGGSERGGERSEGGLDGMCRFANIQRGARRLRSSIRSLVPIILSN